MSEDVVGTRTYVGFLRALLEMNELVAMLEYTTVLAPFAVDVIPEKKPTWGDDFMHLYESLSFRDDNRRGRFPQLLCEIMIQRVVDLFYTYLAELLLAIFHVQPELLATFGKAKLETVPADDTSEHLHSLALRTVDEWSFGGFPSIRKRLVQVIGYDIEVPTKELTKVSEAIALRNIIVHNRCHVNERFLRHTGRKDLVMGSPFSLSRWRDQEYTWALKRTARIIDSAVVRRFDEDLELLSFRGFG